ncbi:MAG: DUF6880 family protein [Janthinobacterium lividum]
MPSGKTLNAANLETLGAPQLAALLMVISKGNAPAQRRLRLALAGNAGAADAARAVLKRLTSIAGAKTRLGWQKIKPFVADLTVQREAILELIAPADPREAFDLLWRLVGCGQGVLGRSDDGSGHLAEAFHAAVRDLGPLAERAGVHPEELASLAVRVLSSDGHGVWDDLIPTLAPSLGRPGLGTVKALMLEWQSEPSATPAHAGETRSRYRRRVVTRVLLQIADALDDVDDYIAQIDVATRRTAPVAAAIARRLLDAGRADDAWLAVEAVEVKQRAQAPAEWGDIRLELLEALNRGDEAQAFRWQQFRSTLDASQLRAYLRKLPDFDDFDVEQQALAHASKFADMHQALAFLIAWPDLRRASELVLGRFQALNGDAHEALTAAADALDDRYPLAAMVLRRCTIVFTLRMTRTARFKHAARQLEACRHAAARVTEFGKFPSHAEFERTLRASYGRKAGFWQEVAKLGPAS